MDHEGAGKRLPTRDQIILEALGERLRTLDQAWIRRSWESGTEGMIQRQGCLEALSGVTLAIPSRHLDRSNTPELGSTPSRLAWSDLFWILTHADLDRLLTHFPH